MYLIKNLYVENITRETLESTLNACGERLTWWAYIIHSRDVKENGEPKKSHYHLLLQWDASDHHAKENIAKAFKPLYKGFESQLIVETVKSINKQCRYLMHLDNKEKAQYSIDEIVTCDMETYQEYIATTIKEKEIDKMLDELLDMALNDYNNKKEMTSGQVLLYFKRLGRLDYYLRNSNKILQLISDYIEEMTKVVF